MLLASDYSSLLRKHFRTPDLVLIQTAHTYLAPLWTGVPLHTFGKVTDKGIRNEREYVEVETWTVNADGTEVARMRTTALLSVEKKSNT
jgi:hypothetical protein